METGSHWQQAAADDDDDDEYVAVLRIKEGTRKRLYEHGEYELDREMDKMYKRDYWEDPEYAPLLERAGLGLARSEAVRCLSYRTLRASRAMRAQWRQERERGRSSRGCKADGESELEPARAAAAASEGGLFFCSCWRSIVDNLAALLRYFLG